MKGYILLPLLALTILSLSTQAQNQKRKVQVTFNEDGKYKATSYKIKLLLGEREIEPDYYEKGFILPVDFDADKIKVTVTMDNHKVNFGEVEKKYFDTDWVIGIDNKPYEKENVGHLPGNLREDGDILYFLEFRSEGWIKYKITIFQ